MEDTGSSPTDAPRCARTVLAPAVRERPRRWARTGPFGGGRRGGLLRTTVRALPLARGRRDDGLSRQQPGRDDRQSKDARGRCRPQTRWRRGRGGVRCPRRMRAWCWRIRAVTGWRLPYPVGPDRLHGMRQAVPVRVAEHYIIGSCYAMRSMLAGEEGFDSSTF